MMSLIAKMDILSLSVPERIQLVEEIWDSIAEVPEEVPLTEAEKAKLAIRLDAYYRDPSAGSPWTEVRRRIQQRARA